MVRFTPWRKEPAPTQGRNDASEKAAGQPRKWNLGILSDHETDEVPGED
jgi:hypothetical protein